MQFFAGVDTHRDTHSVVILNQLGQVVDTFTIPATSIGYAEAIERAARHGELEWGLEGWQRLVRSAFRGCIKRSRRRLRRRGKSDVQDAQAIAESVLRERTTLPRLRPFVERLVPELLELRGCSTISAAGLSGHTGSISN